MKINLIVCVVLTMLLPTLAFGGIYTEVFDGFVFSSGDGREVLILDEGNPCSNPTEVVFTPANRSLPSKTIALEVIDLADLEFDDIDRLQRFPPPNSSILRSDGRLQLSVLFQGAGIYSYCDGFYQFTVASNESLVMNPDLFFWDSRLFAPVVEIDGIAGKAVEVPFSTGGNFTARICMTYGPPTLQLNPNSPTLEAYEDRLDEQGIDTGVLELPNQGQAPFTDLEVTGYLIPIEDYRDAARRFSDPDDIAANLLNPRSRVVDNPDSTPENPLEPVVLKASFPIKRQVTNLPTPVLGEGMAANTVCPLYVYDWTFDFSFSNIDTNPANFGFTKKVVPGDYILIFGIEAPSFADNGQEAAEAFFDGVRDFNGGLVIAAAAGSSTAGGDSVIRFSANGMRVRVSETVTEARAIELSELPLSIVDDTDDGDLLPDVVERAMFSSPLFTDGTYDDDGDSQVDLADFLQGENEADNGLTRLLVESEFGEIQFSCPWAVGSFFRRDLVSLQLRVLNQAVVVNGVTHFISQVTARDFQGEVQPLLTPRTQADFADNSAVYLNEPLILNVGGLLDRARVIDVTWTAVE